MCDAAKQVTIPLLGAQGQQLSVWLFKNVKNAKAIQQQLVAGSLEPELAFINAKLVPDLLVVQAAAQKALAAQLRGSLRTRSLHAELVYNLSGSKHVGQSLQRFGLSEDTDQILVASFHMDDPDAAKVLNVIEGEPADLHYLSSLTDLATVKKDCCQPLLTNQQVLNLCQHLVSNKALFLEQRWAIGACAIQKFESF